MSTPVEIIINDMVESPTINPAGKIIPGILISYTVAGARQYRTWLQLAKTDLPAIQTAIRQEELERAKIVGTKFSLG